MDTQAGFNPPALNTLERLRLYIWFWEKTISWRFHLILKQQGKQGKPWNRESDFQHEPDMSFFLNEEQVHKFSLVSTECSRGLLHQLQQSFNMISIARYYTHSHHTEQGTVNVTDRIESRHWEWGSCETNVTVLRSPVRLLLLLPYRRLTENSGDMKKRKWGAQAVNLNFKFTKLLSSVSSLLLTLYLCNPTHIELQTLMHGSTE